MFLEKKNKIRKECFEILDVVYGEVKEELVDFRLKHIDRVVDNCIKIVGEDFENIDELLYGGYLHDICKFMDDKNHNVLGSMVVEFYLKDKDIDIELVKKCILYHGFKVRNFKDNDEFMYKVLHDCDKLDKISKESLESRNWYRVKELFPGFIEDLIRLNENLVLNESLVIWEEMNNYFVEFIEKV